MTGEMNEIVEILKIAKVLISSDLAMETRKRFNNAFDKNYDYKKGKDFVEWFLSKFPVNTRTPRGTPKDKVLAKKQAVMFVELLRDLMSSGGALDAGNLPPHLRVHFQDKLESGLNIARMSFKNNIERNLDDLVSYFSTEGSGVSVPVKINIGNIEFENRVGLNEKSLQKYAKSIAQTLNVSGWRRKALKGGLKVVLAGPADFRGTSGGKYRQSEDALYVRATPKVLKRAEGYGSVNYILVHELAHRYEKKVGLPENFDVPEWWTTKYSMTDSMAGSESFASHLLSYSL
jgi:hypothetical protein